jgi:hypothetical protein
LIHRCAVSSLTVRRLARILLNATTALSLVLFTATVVLWVRSYWWLDVFPVSRGQRTLALVSDEGSVDFRWYGYGNPLDHMGQHWGHAHSYTAYAECLAKLTRFWAYTHRRWGPSDNQPDLGVTVPHWSLVALTSGMPVLWLRRRRHLSRCARLGLCPVCGYDLRATSERCPECGTIPAR